MYRIIRNITINNIIRCMAVFFVIFLVVSCENTEENDSAANKADRIKEENQMVAYINKICRTKPDEASTCSTRLKCHTR